MKNINLNNLEIKFIFIEKSFINKNDLYYFYKNELQTIYYKPENKIWFNKEKENSDFFITYRKIIEYLKNIHNINTIGYYTQSWEDDLLKEFL